LLSGASTFHPRSSHPQACHPLRQVGIPEPSANRHAFCRKKDFRPIATRRFLAQREDNGMTAQIFKYDAKGTDKTIKLEELDLARIGDKQLIWIDIEGSQAKLLPQIAKRLKLDSTHLTVNDKDLDNAPENFATHLRFAAVTAPAESSGKHISKAAAQKVLGKKVIFFIGEKWLLTLHDQPAEFLDNFREQDRAESKVGLLTPSTLAASLLDWMLTEYYSSKHYC
jgi:hypothetical protein